LFQQQVDTFETTLAPEGSTIIASIGRQMSILTGVINKSKPAVLTWSNIKRRQGRPEVLGCSGLLCK